MNLAQSTAARAPSQESRSAAADAVYATAHWLLSRERATDAARVFRVMIQIAPHDERGWLGLGECHERIGQMRVAAELYGAASVVTGGVRSASVRCLVARARAMSKLGREHDVVRMLDDAERAAAEQGDESLIELVSNERRRLS
jgi:predicted Zn-dependent protease